MDRKIKRVIGIPDIQTDTLLNLHRSVRGRWGYGRGEGNDTPPYPLQLSGARGEGRAGEMEEDVIYNSKGRLKSVSYSSTGS